MGSRSASWADAGRASIAARQPAIVARNRARSALELRVELRDGSSRGFRLLPTLPTSTFLLSPLLDSVDDWIDAYAPGGAPSSVARMRIEEEGGGGCFEAFDLEVDVLPAATRVGIPAEAARELHARVRDH